VSRVEKIDKEQQQKVRKLADDFQKILSQPILGENIESILIIGHTDDMPTSREEYSNWDLATNRSMGVLKYLFDSNPALKQDQYAKYFGIVGYSKYHPEIQYESLEGEALAQARNKNRRTTFQITLKNSSLKDELIKYLEKDQ
jgi:flagellar motor protein MotB